MLALSKLAMAAELQGGQDTYRDCGYPEWTCLVRDALPLLASKGDKDYEYWEDILADVLAYRAVSKKGLHAFAQQIFTEEYAEPRYEGYTADDIVRVF